MKNVNIQKLYQDIPRDIVTFVKGKGFDPKLDGFGYICYGVMLLEASTKDHYGITQLYLDIAEKVGGNSTYSKVERAIRHCIKSSGLPATNGTILNLLAMEYVFGI